MTNSETDSAQAPAKKHPEEAVAKRHHQHADRRAHPGEFDIDLHWHCEDMSEQLQALRQILHTVIDSLEHCQKHHHHHGSPSTEDTGSVPRNYNYHNITVCSGQHS